MTVRTSFISAALKLGSGQVVVQLCSFIRSVILARLISPDDYGIAATFAMTFALLEMLSNLSVQTLLVQAPDGDDAPFQETGQLLIVLRGCINSAILLIMAMPLSLLFGVPQALWAFRWVALLPLMGGFIHLDLSRYQRNMRFTPQVAVGGVSSVLVTLLAWPLAAWLRDYSAMLWLMLIQTAVTTIGTHVVAERRYAWSWQKIYVRRFLTFGWPLTINGILMYGILQGDRFIIGSSQRLFHHSTYTLSDLGVYSVAFAITMAPSTLFTSMATSLFLPLLSSAQEDSEQFVRRSTIFSQILAFAAASIAIPFIVAGSWIVPLIYGSKYAAAGSFIGWLGMMWGVRVFRTAPTQAALALGDSRNSMIANIARSAALIGVLISAATGSSLTSIAICGLFGEIFALAVCLWRLSAKHHIPAKLALKPFVICGTTIVVAWATQLGAFGWMVMVPIGVVLLGLCAGTMLLCFPDLRQNVQDLLCFTKPQIVEN